MGKAASANDMIYTAEQIAFWSCVTLLAYVYVGYPVLVYIVSVLFTKAVNSSQIQPSVTVLITAFNEENAIREKLENTLLCSRKQPKLFLSL